MVIKRHTNIREGVFEIINEMLVRPKDKYGNSESVIAIVCTGEPTKYDIVAQIKGMELDCFPNQSGMMRLWFAHCEVNVIVLDLSNRLDHTKLLALELTTAFVVDYSKVDESILSNIQSRIGRMPPMRDKPTGMPNNTWQPFELHVTN